MTIYTLRIITPKGEIKRGMYSCGDAAATPDLARRLPGNIIRSKSELLAVTQSELLPGLWTDSAGNSHKRYTDPVVIEMEREPGEWGIPATAYQG